MTALDRIVIVGNGIAGVTAADTLRGCGFDGEITLIGDEPHPAYSRPALSKALLRDEDDLTSHLLPPPMHGATELQGRRAVSIDTTARTVVLDGGETLAFDGLMIATGRRPRLLGGTADAGRQLTLRTVDDAIELRRRLADRPSVIVVGGGPLGMEVASGALDAGCTVTLVSNGRPLAALLGTFVSDIFIEAATARGLRVVETRATGLGVDSGQVVLADGRTLCGDVVVTAIGDQPNVEWLADSGLLVEGQLHADNRGAVAPGIVAAGDVAVVQTPLGNRRVPLWNAAIEQSRIAAAHLVGADTQPPEAHPYFWTEQFGLSLKAVGHLPLSGTPTTVGEPGTDGAVLLQWPDEGHGGAAVAINVRIPIPKLRRIARGDA